MEEKEGVIFGCWGVEEKVVTTKESQKLLHGISEEEWKGIVAKTYTCQTFTIIFLFKPCNNPIPFPFYGSAN